MNRKAIEFVKTAQQVTICADGQHFDIERKLALALVGRASMCPGLNALKAIMDRTCAQFIRVTPIDIMGTSRYREVSMARGCYCHVAAELTVASWREIAIAMCRGDHTTAITAARICRRNMKTVPGYAARVEAVLESCKDIRHWSKTA